MSHLTPDQAAQIIGVDAARMQLMIKIGAVISSDESGQVLIDPDSAQRAAKRHAEMRRARAAFSSDDPLDRISYLSGLSREEIEGLDGGETANSSDE